MSPKSEQLKAFILSQFPKESLSLAVYGITKYTTDIHLMDQEELERLYTMLFPDKKIQPIEEKLYGLELEKELKRLRSIILKDCAVMGIYTPGDWTRFNAFMKYKSVLKKPLNTYKIDEFNTLIKQIKSMRSKFEQHNLKVESDAWRKMTGIYHSEN